MRIKSAILTAVLVVSLVGAAAAPAATQETEAEGYSGAFIEFETTDAAVSDYAVDGQVVVDSLRVQSAGEAGGEGDAEGGVGVGVGADSAVSIDGAAVQSQNSAGARASVAFESGAQLEANDNRRGVVRVTADGGDQVVQANVSGDARSEGDNRVVVSGDDGAQGTFIVVGDGNISANGDGQVTAAVGEGGQVVYRQYDGERSDSEQQQEQFIQDGTAAAELFVRGAADSGDDGGENETSVVTYDENTDAEVTSRSENRINATVDRTQQQGKVVVVTVAESAVESAESLEVLIDGEAAAQADSYGEIEQSAEEGDESRYLVRQSSSAEAAVDVVIGIDGFSERQLSIQDADGGESTPTEGTGDGGDETDSDGETDTDGDDGGSSADGPGFGALAALIALTAALVAAAARRR